ncbi:uncharacterized protein EI90DRAFT_1379671 [Cantharellus anzutake]|uniref:uncharacterized protein n=1 Tax=Cantharellus anzutake TaxID=1750568 RepID=UPI001903F3A7|nr:uncharacterized protein EI90DRAFT_1379671 [Cantharellus anzutake]KAF8329336.1 hypothetical protein EI90DRAFT_1379671 [Cantharellus anzutake]
MYNCKICLDDEELISSLPCGHIFGTTCIEIHLRITPSCPSCRRSYTPRDLMRLHPDFLPVEPIKSLKPLSQDLNEPSVVEEFSRTPTPLPDLIPVFPSDLGLSPLYNTHSGPNEVGQGGEEEESMLHEEENAIMQDVVASCLPSPNAVGGSGFASQRAPETEVTRLEEAVKTHIQILSNAVKDTCSRLKYATLINAVLEETMDYITIMEEREVEIEDMTESAREAGKQKDEVMKKLARLKRKDREV